jgi:hypothetical protein
MIMRNPIILVVDSDLGFVFWLGQVFDHAGFSAFPAKSTTCAIELIREHKLSLDILVINPVIQHAVSFMTGLRQYGGYPKIVFALGQSSETWSPVPEVDCIKPKPQQFTTAVADEWINLIRTLSGGASIEQHLSTVPEV